MSNNVIHLILCVRYDIIIYKVISELYNTKLFFMKRIIFGLLLLVSFNSFSQIPNYVPTNGLVGYWPFNGNANDLSANGNNGTVINATLTSDRNGSVNNAYYFNGNAQINAINPLYGNTTEFSGSVWLNMNDSCITRDVKIVGSWNNGGCQFVLYKHLNNISLSIGAHALSFPLNNSHFNNWINVSFTYSSIDNWIKLYCNGVNVANVKRTHIPSSCVNTLQIGYQLYNTNYFWGKIDEIGLWNRALTPIEINRLYTSNIKILPPFLPSNGILLYYPLNGNTNDESGNGFTGISEGLTPTKGFNKKDSSAFMFDNINKNSKVIMSGFETATMNNFSFSFWAKPGRDIANGILAQGSQLNGFTNQILLHPLHGESYANAYNDVGFGVLYGKNGIYLLEHTANYQYIPLSYSTNLTDWNFITIVYENKMPKLYLNGNFIKNGTPGTKNVRTSIGTELYAGSTLNYLKSGIGFGYDTSLYSYNGLIDEIAAWNRVLTPTEIAGIYMSYVQQIPPNDTISIRINSPDTLTFPNKLSFDINTNNLISRNISAYELKLNYDSTRFKFDSVSKINTTSTNGNFVINHNTRGTINVAWASSNTISLSSLPLLKCFFTPIDSGSTTVSIEYALFNTDTVQNKFSKTAYVKYNFGDIDINNKIQAYDASIALKYSVGLDPIPNIDPLPWEPWRIKIASVDTSSAVTANDASLILKYVVGLITKFPKRGLAMLPGFVTVSIENNELVFRSFEDLGGVNISFLDNHSNLSAPSYVNSNAMFAINQQTSTYKIGMAFTEAPANGTVLLRIPITSQINQPINIQIDENTNSRIYQLNTTTGINEKKYSDINIYPNPTNDVINIKGLASKQNTSIYIYDVQGKLVLTKELIEKGTIDLSELNNGVYIIKIDEMVQRIVKI